jgi:hypothetical protein
MEFSVPTSLATRSSKFIKAALSNPMKEAHEKRISLPDTDPETLEGYLNWIYTGHITLEQLEPQEPMCEDCQKIDARCVGVLTLDLAKIYTLGDYLNDLRFCNAIVDALEPASCDGHRVATLDATQWVWDHTTADCPLREHCLEVWKRALAIEEMQSLMEEQSFRLSHSFTVDLLIFIGRRHKTELERDMTVKAKSLEQKCKFHKHVDDFDTCS